MSEEKQMKRLLIVAGEASGDLHGGSMVCAIKKSHPDCQFFGMGGNKMRDQGVHTFFDIDRMGAVGLIEVLGEIPHHLKVYRKLKREIASRKYDGVILIDYPTLNMRLAKCAWQAGCPVYFFISPQVWAWRRGRIKKIRQWVSKMYVVLPFEEPMYLKEGVDAEFLGHPFVDQVKPKYSKKEAQEAFGLDPALKTVGLLPGSRKKEIESLLPVMIEAASEIRKQEKGCQFILPIADSIPESMVREFLGDNPLKVRLLPGQAYEVMNMADCLIIASGSATLEAGMLGCPMVIIYTLHPVTYWLAKILIKTRFIGLVNIVAGESVAPELIQKQVTAENITVEVLKILKNPDLRSQASDRLLKIRQSLGEPGVMERVAKSIAANLYAKPGHEKSPSP